MKYQALVSLKMERNCDKKCGLINTLRGKSFSENCLKYRKFYFYKIQFFLNFEVLYYADKQDLCPLVDSLNEVSFTQQS